MSISVERHDGTVVVSVGAPLLHGNRKELQQHVMDAVDAGARRVLVDLKDTGYVDTAGLGTLVMLSKRASAHGVQLRLVNLNRDVCALLALTRLDTVLNVGADEGAPAA